MEDNSKQKLLNDIGQKIMTQLNRITEELTPRHVIEFEEIKILKGSFEESFKIYKNMQSVEGNYRREMDFFKEKLIEVKNIDEALRAWLRKLYVEDNLEKNYYAISSKIGDLTILLEDLIEGRITMIDIRQKIYSDLDIIEKYNTKKKVNEKVYRTYKLKDGAFLMKKFVELLKEYGFVTKETKFKTVEFFFLGKNISKSMNIPHLEFNTDNNGVILLIIR